jgi:membrane protease YdiL (CAAX protease family)
MRCSHCGAALGRDAAWCGLCHQPVTASAVPATAVATLPPPAPAFDPSTARAALSGAFYSPPATPTFDLAPADAPARGAGRATFLAIAVGALANGALWLWSRGRTVENEAAIRYAILTTMAVYAIVAVIVMRRVARNGHPLRWRGTGGLVPSALLGVLLGAGLAGLLAAGAAAAGQHGGDPRVALLVSEGDVAHVAAALLLTVVAAPIVEELLFRGLLLASLTRHGNRAALWLSAAAFSVWHLNPSALKYYVFAGLFLGFLYLRRGLSCSIAAHAGFNGVLTVLAILYALAPGVTATTAELTVRAPHGWHVHEGSDQGIDLVGPSGGEVAAMALPGGGAPVSAATLAQRIADGQIRDIAHAHLYRDTVQVVDLPEGEAVRVRMTYDGHDGDLVLLATPRRVYIVYLASGGSPRVRADFDRMLESLSVAG